MTFSRFFGLGLLLWVLLSIIKALFLNVLGLDTLPSEVIFGFVVFIVSMACARRLGVINYLEGALVAVMWTIGLLVADFFILRPILGWSVFTKGIFWAGYAVSAAAIFFFHKKRHVQIRKELAAHHHGHGGHHGGEHKDHGDHHQQAHGHQEPGKHH